MPAEEGSALPCGWARQRGYPCIDPIFYSWVSVIGQLSLLCGTWAYVSYLQKWPFRRIFAVTQAIICVLSFNSLLWVWRFNARVGISDNMWILFGDEILLDFVSKL